MYNVVCITSTYYMGKALQLGCQTVSVSRPNSRTAHCPSTPCAPIATTTEKAVAPVGSICVPSRLAAYGPTSLRQRSPAHPAHPVHPAAHPATSSCSSTTSQEDPGKWARASISPTSPNGLITTTVVIHHLSSMRED